MRNDAYIRNELIEKFRKQQPDGETFLDLKVNGLAIGDSPYFEDYVRIGVLLSNGAREPKIRLALATLENEMIAKVKGITHWWSSAETKAKDAIDHFGKVTRHYTDKLKTAAPKDSDYSKLLTASLLEFEQAHGFLTTEKPPNYAGFVYGNVFKEALAKKQHWKDVGAGEKHGEFTHRLHWYVAIRAGCIQDVPPMQEATVFASIEPWQKGKTNLWTSLFDLLTTDDSIGGDADDFRSPENFNMWLVGDSSPEFCPVLRSFLRARMSKRQGTYMLVPYLMKKTGKTQDAIEALVFEPGKNSSARLVYPEGKPVISPYVG